jgi:hypothetical protein
MNYMDSNFDITLAIGVVANENDEGEKPFPSEPKRSEEEGDALFKSQSDNVDFPMGVCENLEDMSPDDWAEYCEAQFDEDDLLMGKTQEELELEKEFEEEQASKYTQDTSAEEQELIYLEAQQAALAVVENEAEDGNFDEPSWEVTDHFDYEIADDMADFINEQDLPF